jgi:DNA-directed RNA polymerase beta' subunit
VDGLNVSPRFTTRPSTSAALDGQQMAVSDLNKLYQTVIFRNQKVAGCNGDYFLLNCSEKNALSI